MLAETLDPPRSRFDPRATCPLCGGGQPRPRFLVRYSKEDSHSFVPEEYFAGKVDFRLLGCRTCGFSFTSPQPTDMWLQELYARTQEPYFAPLAETAPERRRFYEMVRAIVKLRGVSSGRVLDVGCGTGHALAGWPREFARYGVEPSRFAAERARAQAAATVHVGDLATAAFPDAFFDVVTGFDVLEHLPDPRRLVQEVARVLRPGGLVVIETGDIESLNARLAGAHWYYVRLPGHLSFFSQRTLERLLVETGYETVEARRIHHGAGGLGQTLGHARAMTRHLLVRVLGPRVLALQLFRSRNLDYSIPYFWDHMLVTAVKPGGPVQKS